MKLITVLIVLSSFSYLLCQTSVGLRFNTGDTQVETHLNDVNGYASADISLFRKDLAVSFKASNSDLDFYLIHERMRPADVYYGYTIAYTTGRPVRDVIAVYKKNKGWGNIAKELGIKPGSREFHRLKNNTLNKISKDKIKSKNKGDDKKKSGSGNKKNGKKNK